MLNGLLDLVLGYGVGVGGVAVALAGAWFLPMFRQTFLWVALGFAIGTICYDRGVSNGSARIQAKWDAAVSAAIEEGRAARAGAERDVLGDDVGGLRNDRFNRNK